MDRPEPFGVTCGPSRTFHQRRAPRCSLSRPVIRCGPSISIVSELRNLYLIRLHLQRTSFCRLFAFSFMSRIIFALFNLSKLMLPTGLPVRDNCSTTASIYSLWALFRPEARYLPRSVRRDAVARLMSFSFLRLLRYASLVIRPFLMGPSRRIQAAVFSFMAGVMPPIPILGRSLL